MPQQPQKRGLFSLNLESDVEQFAQRIGDGITNSLTHNTSSRSSSRGHPGSQRTSVEILTKPFEQSVQRTIDGVVKEEKINPSPGKKVVSAGSGELTTTTITSNRTNSREPVVRKTVVKQDISGGNTHRRERASSSSAAADLGTLEDKYDTSDL